MREILLVVEDFGQKSFVVPVIHRLAAEFSVPVNVTDYSVRGGKGEVGNSLKRFFHDLASARTFLPDALIIGWDANCKGYNGIRKLLDGIVLPQFRQFVVYAIPDPHIERWMLLDSHAFRQVFRVGCTAPDYKCDKDRYKEFLYGAIGQSGTRPSLGGMEFARDVVEAMDLQNVSRQDESFRKFIEHLRDKFQEWSR